LNSQVVSSTGRQVLANSGLSFWFSSLPSRPSKTCLRRALFGPTLWKCGSIDVTSEATAIFSSWATAGALKPSATGMAA
jgi:hypothetical protein